LHVTPNLQSDHLGSAPDLNSQADRGRERLRRELLARRTQRQAGGDLHEDLLANPAPQGAALQKHRSQPVAARLDGGGEAGGPTADDGEIKGRRHVAAHRSRLKVTLSVPAAEVMRNFSSHQPPMLNFTPST